RWCSRMPEVQRQTHGRAGARIGAQIPMCGMRLSWVGSCGLTSQCSRRAHARCAYPPRLIAVTFGGPKVVPMTDDLSAYYEAFRDALDQHKRGWRVTEQGLIGPDGALVRLGHRHPSQAEGHVDVQFVLDVASPTKTELWDCVAGFGATPA